MLRGHGLLITSVSLLLAGCTGDEFLVGGGGNDGAGGGPTTAGTGVTSTTGTAATSTASSVSSAVTTATASTGSGGCTGCMQGETCTDGTAVDACGSAGQACQACTTADPCKTPSCNGACGEIAAQDNVPCEFVPGDPTSGACLAGVCAEARENCGNGEDDDEDGMPDCLDSDCDLGFTCVQPTPADWTGPVAVYLGDVACPPVWGAPAEGEFGTEAGGVGPDDFACECECTVTGCDSISFEYGTTPAGDDTCLGIAPTTQILNEGDCAPIGVSTTATFATNAQPVGIPGCTGDLTTPIPAPSFDDPVTVCENPGEEGGAGCDEGACRPRAPNSGGAEGLICVFHEGDVDCPEDTDFNTIIVVATEFDDTRACDCDCIDPGCGAEIGFFDESGCDQCNGSNGACASLGLEEPCASDIPAEGAIYAGWQPTCDTVDAESGALAPGGLVTYCCL